MPATWFAAAHALAHPRTQWRRRRWRRAGRVVCGGSTGPLLVVVPSRWGQHRSIRCGSQASCSLAAPGWQWASTDAVAHAQVRTRIRPRAAPRCACCAQWPPHPPPCRRSLAGGGRGGSVVRCPRPSAGADSASGARGSCGSSGCAGPGASVRAPVLVMTLAWPAPWPAQRQSADAGARGSAVPRPRPTPVTECCRQCERRRWVVDVDCAVTSGRQECRCRRQCESACAQLELARGAQVTLPVFLCAGREDGAQSPNNGHFVPRPSHPIHAQHGKGAVAVPVHHD